MRRFSAVVLTVLAAVMAAGCGSSDSASRPSSSSQGSNAATTTLASATTTLPTTKTTFERTVDDVIGAYVRSVGHDYAGDCGDTTLSADVGKHCSVLHEDRGATRVYAIGPTFSEFDTWLLLQQRADGWSVTDSASAGTLDNPNPSPW